MLTTVFGQSGQHPDSDSTDLEAKMADQNGSASEGPANATGGPAEGLEERFKRPFSAVTSGRKLLLEGDVHSAWSRRYRDVITSLTSDLGGRELIGEAKAARGRMSEGLNVDADNGLTSLPRTSQ
jgi:hypothetical protein